MQMLCNLAPAIGDALLWLPEERVPNGCQRSASPTAAKGARPQRLPEGRVPNGCQRGASPTAAKGARPQWQA